MPKFKFKAKNLNNKVIHGVFFAKNEDDLREIISNLDYYLISSKKIPESAQLFGFLEKIKIDELSLFCRQLSIMLDAGVELSKGIEILKSNTKNNKLKTILDVVHYDLMQGMMLSQSLSKYPKTFPTFFRNMIHIGELSGKTSLVLNRLAEYYEKDTKTKRKVKSALAYPIFLLILCVGILSVLSLYVMPIFKDVFESLNAELPPITIIVLNISDFIKNNVFYILTSLILATIIFILLLRNKKIKKRCDYFNISYSIQKHVILASITSRFTNGFSTLLSSSISIVDALTIMSKLLGNSYVEEKLAITISEIKRGQSIAKSLETINIFPNILIEMISVGEQSGQIEEVINRDCNNYDDQVDYAIKKLTAFIEPIMIILIGIIVIIVLLSIFLPMLDISNSIETGV